MLFTPKQVPLNWYRYDVGFSIDLLRQYVRGVENQIAEGIEAFHKHKEIRIDEATPHENDVQTVTVHRGLDDETWDLKGVFEDHFPNLQRRGALITLYSFLEHELNDLCGLF